MAQPIIKIKRGAIPPSANTLQAGEFAIDQAAKNLYLGIEAGGVVTNEIVGGSGTFAKKADLGTMSTQNANSVAITGGTIDGTAIGANIASTGRFTTIQDDGSGSGQNIFGNQTQFGWGIGGVGSNPLYVSSTLDLSIGSGIIELGTSGNGAVRGLGTPVNENDAARKKYVDDAVASLTSVFRYIGEIVHTGTAPYDLDAMSPDKTTGAYYRVAVAGTFTSGADSYKAKAGDAFVKTTTGWQKIDNVDAEVLPTANEIAVTGDENVGYTVSIDPVFSGRVSTAETDIDDLQTKTQNIDFATTAGTTKFNGTISLGDPSAGASISDIGTITAVASGGDKFFEASYLAGITLGAKYMPGHTVKINTNLVGVDHPSNGTPSIENFIIDGGVY